MPEPPRVRSPQPSHVFYSSGRPLFGRRPFRLRHVGVDGKNHRVEIHTIDPNKHPGRGRRVIHEVKIRASGNIDCPILIVESSKPKDILPEDVGYMTHGFLGMLDGKYVINEGVHMPNRVEDRPPYQVRDPGGSPNLFKLLPFNLLCQ